MRSPALAFASEFGRGHGTALKVLGAYMFLAAITRLFVLDPGQIVRLDPPNEFAGLVIVPASVTFLYVLAVFSFGLEGDLTARGSIYPARMFTLPVSTAALAGWPMLFGSITMVCLWLGIAIAAPWPPEIDVPLVWPALLAAVFLAWTQVLTWMAYGLPGLRIVVTVLWLAALDATVMLAIHFEAQESAMVALLAPQLPLAYLAACFVLARARRGEMPDWRGFFPRGEGIVESSKDEREAFASSAIAQRWLEWRLHGSTLPTLVLILLPFELALLFLARNEPPALVFYTLLGVLLTPPFMASFVAATLSRPDPSARDSHGLPPFLATRPLTSAALIEARLKVTIWSTLAAWLLVLVATLLALGLSGTLPIVTERMARVIEIVGTPRTTVAALLLLGGLVVSTWRQLVQSLYIGLTGRAWLIKSSVLLSLAALTAVWPLARWIARSQGAQAALWDALPWIPAALVVLKMAAAAWVAVRLHSSRLVSDRTLVLGASCWVALVLALWGLLAWLFDSPHIPRYFLGLIAILGVPLARLSAAPLALAWNRHR